MVWSPLAIEKLEATAKFIDLDKPMLADKWVNDVFDRTDSLGFQPELGRQVPELLGTNYREVNVNPATRIRALIKAEEFC